MLQVYTVCTARVIRFSTMLAVRVARLLLAACAATAAAYQVAVPPNLDYGYMCNGIYAGRNSSAKSAYTLTVTFAEGGNGSVAAAVIPREAYGILGIREMDTHGMILKETLLCGNGAIAQGLCKQGDYGHFLLDHTKPESAKVTQWRADIGKAFELVRPH